MQSENSVKTGDSFLPSNLSCRSVFGNGINNLRIYDAQFFYVRGNAKGDGNLAGENCHDAVIMRAYRHELFTRNRMMPLHSSSYETGA